MKRFSEEEICRFEAWGGGRERKLDYENAGPSAMCNLPQHVLEPIVHKAAVAAGTDVRRQAVDRVDAAVRRRRGRRARARRARDPAPGPAPRRRPGARGRARGDRALARERAGRAALPRGARVHRRRRRLRGEAGEALLDTYEQERLPVGRQVVERAIKSMGNLVPVMEAIAKGGVDAAGDVDTSVLTGPGEQGERRRAELADALELQHWHFDALGVELGQAYRSDAVVAEDGAPPAPDDGIDRELHHVPTTAPGARLPHAWLSRDQRRVSTHDITGKGRFTLLVGIDGAEWSEAAERLADELDVPLGIEPIGLGQRNADVLGAWAKVREVDDDGAILVRPDAQPRGGAALPRQRSVHAHRPLRD